MSATDLLELASNIAGAEQASIGSSGCSPADMHRLGFYFSRKILSQEASAAERRQFACHCLSYFEGASYRARPSTQGSATKRSSVSELKQRVLERDQRRAELRHKKMQKDEAARAKLAERDRLRAALAARIAAAQARRVAGQQGAAIATSEAERARAAVMLETAPAASIHPSPDKRLEDPSPSPAQTSPADWKERFDKMMALYWRK